MPTYLVWNKNQSLCSSAYARQTTQNIQTSKGGKHGARQPLDGITSASEPKHTQKGKRGARQPITGLTSASEPKAINSKLTHAKRKKVARSGLARPPAYIPCLEQGSGRCSSPERDRKNMQTSRESGTRAYKSSSKQEETQRRQKKLNTQTNRESGTRA